jgi:hypothetical protein
MGASGQIVILESLVAGGFLLVAVIGFKTSLWLVVAALVGHGIFGFVYHLFIENAGVPHWVARLLFGSRCYCWRLLGCSADEAL